jgi:hypothetical protein
MIQVQILSTEMQVNLTTSIDVLFNFSIKQAQDPTTQGSNESTLGTGCFIVHWIRITGRAC